ncbi:MAG: hypothetical protein WKF88_05185 [Ferruginibacter sp.]
MKTILLLFVIKVAAGCTLGLVNHFLLRNTTDYDTYNQLGIAEYHTLFSDPALFFTDIFKSNYTGYGEYFGSTGSYWNDLRTNIIFKVLGIMNIFSGGNYYINSLFFNFISFLGHVALYRVFITVYPKRNSAVIVGCFLLPSVLYFSSGIHKDLIIFTALCIFCYSLFFLLRKGVSRKRIFFLIASFLVMLVIRNFIAVIVLPWALAWFISSRYRIAPAKVFLSVGLLLALGVLGLHYTAPAYDPLRVIVAQQQSFLSLDDAATEFQTDTLTPGIKSFVVAAPSAIRHAWLSPYPGEFQSPFIHLFSAEMVLYWILFFIMLIFPLPNGATTRDFIWFGLACSFSVLFFTGYITPAAGALIRYRSIYLPFILTPVLASIDWKRLFS